jgi:hypothetical protein
MLRFLSQYGLEILFGTISAMTSVLAIYYARQSNRLAQQLTLRDARRSVEVFLTREVMIGSLLAQYTAAKSDEEIWAHTVGLQNYPGDVHDRILSAASKGVTFRLIVDVGSPGLTEFLKLFEPIRQAAIVGAHDNKLRVQGLGKREVIIALPTLTTYTALRITDENFVALVKDWYDRKWATLVAHGYIQE